MCCYSWLWNKWHLCNSISACMILSSSTSCKYLNTGWVFKVTRARFGINMGKKILTIPKSLNNCVIEHKQYRYHVLVLKKMCTNQDISNLLFIMKGNHFLVNGHKKDLPHITCIFHLWKYVVKHFLVSAILHLISLLTLLPKSYFKISTFQPNFLCSSSFNVTHIYYTIKYRCMSKIRLIC